MSSRLAIGIGVPICLALMATASQIQAQTGAPSPADIEQQLRPAPKLGPSQGLPHMGVSGPEANPGFNPASTSPERGGSAPSAGKRPSSGVAASHMPAPTETHAPSMAFSTIQFAFGSTQLTPESSATLKNLGVALNHQLADQKSFLIEGHTDRKGTRAYNDELSKGRAEAVKEYLVHEAGVSPDRLQTVGKGYSEPVNLKNPYAAENRRVVVVNTGS